MSPHDLPPPAQMMNLISGKFATQMVAVAAHIGVADRLKDGPRTSDEVAKAAGTHPDATYRLLRGLSVFGVVVEHDGRRFSLTPVGECLRTDTPGSLAPMAKFFGASWHHAVWAELLYSVKTGDQAFKKVHGKDNFEWAIDHPAEFAVFNAAMTSLSSIASKAVVDAYDFSACKQIADVGGGHGYLLAEILAHNPSARGVLFDMPQVVEGAKKLMGERGLQSRCEAVGGDFFKAVPERCDMYVMKHIIHDWNDEASITILSNIARAMEPSGRVALVENVMTPPSEPHFSKLLDIEMLLATPGGRERTEAEYGSLFTRAGLRLTRVVPTQAGLSVVEAVRKG